MLLMDRPFGRVELSAPLTLAEYLALPEDTRVEIVDGVLRPMVHSSLLSREVQSLLSQALRVKKPKDLRVAEEQVVVFGVKPPTARIPDLVLFRASGDLDSSKNFTLAHNVLLAVEVVSPGSETADRHEKPAEYARNGIASFWRIELAPEIAAHVFTLKGDTYEATGVFKRGDVLTDSSLPWFSVTVGDLLGDYA